MSLHIDIKYVRLISSRLRNFKQKKDYLFNFSCPFCGDSKKKTTKARGYVYSKKGGLFYSCHNCGIGTNAANLIKQVDSSLHQEYILERYKSGESGVSNFKAPTFDIPTPKFGKVQKQKIFEYAEWCDKLQSGHFCLTYIENRKIPKKFYSKLLFTNKYKTFIDELVPNHGKELVNDARLIIPFYNEFDELVAVSGRALETSDFKLKYITVRTQESDKKLIFGMNTVNTKLLVKIVEGPIDSLFLSNCVASCDSNLSNAAKNIQADNKVLIYDNEPRNKEIVGLMKKAIKENHSIVIWPDTIGYKDINEMIQNGMEVSEIENIIEENTFCGINALTKFTFWKKV
jgi:transcription elongation factor Elf1